MDSQNKLSKYSFTVLEVLETLEGDLDVEGRTEQVRVIYYCHICHVYRRHLFIILNYHVF